MELTREQKQAVSTFDEDLLVSASAGSGKTRVLIARVLNILSSKLANLNEILVMTFTNNASVEMKNRLRTELKMATDPELKTQLDELEIADIFTIHNFCQKVIKEFCYESGISPNFSILDEKEADFLKTEALENVILKHTEKVDEKFLSVYQSFNDFRNDEKLKGIIISIYKFLRSKQNYKVWAYDSLENCYTTDLKNNYAVEFFNNQIVIMAQNFTAEFESLKLRAEQIESTKLLGYIEMYLQSVKNFNDDYENNFKNLFVKNFDSIYSSKNFTMEEIELKEELQKTASAYKDELKFYSKAMGDKSIKENVENFAHIKYVLKNLIDLVFEFETEYDKIKSQKQAVDFDDLQHLCLQTLKSETVKDVLKNRYKFVLIDEYQDTNEIQEEIVKQITKSNNLFMVGDVKQSIYMFRQCSPQIFIDKFNSFSANKKLGEVIKLNENFRSEKPILDFSNFVFNKIMQNETAKLDYNKNSQLIYGNKLKSYEQKQIKNVVVKIIAKEEQKKQKENPDKIYKLTEDVLHLNDETELKRECYLVADTIKKLKNEKIFDEDIKDFRFVDFKDIAILTRKKLGVVDEISTTLQELEIPINTEYSFDLYNSYEVLLLHNYLKLLDNFNQDIPLVSVLNSFIVKLNENDLALIKKSEPNCKFFWQAVKNYAEQKDDEISIKINSLLKQLKNFRTEFLFLNLRQLMQKVVDFYGFETELLKFKLVDNLEKLEYVISNVESIKNTSLNSYLNYIDNFATSNKVKQVVKQSENSVTLTTIHSSKGLEYPVVILINTDQEFSNESVKGKVIKNNDLGFGMDYFDNATRSKANNLVKNSIALKIKEQERQEEMRLLYVALTRAKNYLILTGTKKLNKILTLDSAYKINNCNNYLDWVLGALNETQQEKLKGGNNLTVLFNGSEFDFEVYSSDLVAEEDKKKDTNESMDIFESDEFKKIIETKFETNPLIMKNTVTALLNDETEFETRDYSVLNLKDSDEDFALIGTVYHKALQYMDFKTTDETNINQKLHDLVNEKIVTEDEIKLVEKNKIVNAIYCLKSLTQNAEVFKEKQFMLNLPANELMNTHFTDKVLVQGVVDLIIKKADEIVLVDYKTSRIKNEKELAKKYELQLGIYARAVEEFFGIKVTQKFIYSIFLDRLVIVWHCFKLKFIINLVN